MYIIGSEGSASRRPLLEDFTIGVEVKRRDSLERDLVVEMVEVQCGHSCTQISYIIIILDFGNFILVNSSFLSVSLDSSTRQIRMF